MFDQFVTWLWVLAKFSQHDVITSKTYTDKFSDIFISDRLKWGRGCRHLIQLWQNTLWSQQMVTQVLSSVRCPKQILSSLLLEADMCADVVSSWVVFGVTFGIRSEHSNFSVNSQHFLLPLKCPSHVIERNTLWHFILCNTWQILCAIN